MTVIECDSIDKYDIWMPDAPSIDMLLQCSSLADLVVCVLCYGVGYILTAHSLIAEKYFQFTPPNTLSVPAPDLSRFWHWFSSHI